MLINIDRAAVVVLSLVIGWYGHVLWEAIRDFILANEERRA
jgi:hypothetical protein